MEKQQKPHFKTYLTQIGYTSILLVFLLGFLASLIFILRSEHQTAQVLSQESEYLVLANNLDKLEDEVAISLHNYLITGDSADIDSIQKNTRDFREKLSDFQSRPIRVETKTLLSLIKTMEVKFNATVQKIIKAKSAGFSVKEVKKLFKEEVSPVRLELNNLTESLVILKQEIFNKEKKNAMVLSSNLKIWTTVCGFLTFLLSISIGWFFSKKQSNLLFKLDRMIIELQKSEAELQKSEAELQKSEAELQKKNVELQQAIRSRDEMVGVISHELKNPLTALQLNTTLIQRSLTKDPGLENVQKLVEKFVPSIQRMNRLISDLLDITRLEAKSLKLEQRITDLADIVNQVVDLYEVSAQDNLTKLNSDIPTECRQVFCDPERTNQILSNLVNNAIKFTNGGSISIHAKKLEQFVEVRVTDTGKGIPNEFLPHVFDRFWQAKDTAYKGTGLGLAITKGLIESHGGKIWVESQPGIGTTFYFTLPLTEK